MVQIGLVYMNCLKRETKTSMLLEKYGTCDRISRILMEKENRLLSQMWTEVIMSMF